jgi:hypothetical protein
MIGHPAQVIHKNLLRNIAISDINITDRNTP